MMKTFAINLHFIVWEWDPQQHLVSLSKYVVRLFCVLENGREERRMCLIYCQNVSFNAEMMLGQLDHNYELLQMFGHPSLTWWTC